MSKMSNLALELTEIAERMYKIPFEDAAESVKKIATIYENAARSIEKEGEDQNG